ncbi:bacterial low temperature requirement A protein-domain-containing protein [Mycotypha africana]|uniref:bacterial low temperature requirement A protein-domain-containing protein n=1 Tax=Mycotypha africana TaxID=64632 RepID=UPI0023018642|nr:bacterial low temperature requirement A protein-domain-containing protein [Mycotypha africana]KAI8977110.1 bacterial low temperature requirement A protein-domain-containing protein [Mycotypha africana]
MSNTYNRGYQGPAFGGRRNSRVRSIATDDERLAVEEGILGNRSNISTGTEANGSRLSRIASVKSGAGVSQRCPIAADATSGAGMGDGSGNSTHSGDIVYDSQHHQRLVAPLHDPSGKPFRRHGSETIGELLLHPLKEFQLHQKRSEAYEAEKVSWNEKHPEAIATDMDEVRIENDAPLIEKEKEELRLFKDTDDFIDFLEKTKRNYSVKIHKTVKIKKQLASAKSDLFHDSSKSSFDMGERNNTNSSHSDSGNNLSDDSSTKAYPHNNRLPTDLLIDLNDNVYIQIQFIPIIQHHAEKKQRKAIFAVPDPDLSDEIGEESSATWVELFGDVFYVGWLSQFTHSVHIDSYSNLNTYAAWFVVMWWTWCSSALYSSRYDRQELCGLIIMAGSSNKAKFEATPKWFIIGYIIMKAVLLFQYFVIFVVSLGAHFKSSRRPLGIYVLASAISIAMWGVSLLYTSQADMGKRYTLWYVSIGMELLVHLFLQGNSRVSLAASHLGERFGLFTLIILGENCMGFIKMVAEGDSTPSTIACNVFGVTIIFCYFFMYFDDFSGEFMARTRLSQLWMYLHFPLHLFQVAFGIALTEIISNHTLQKDTAAYLTAALQACASAVSGHATGEEHTAQKPATAAAEHYSVLSLSAEAGSHSSGEAAGHGDCDPSFSIKIFWITAGLILCFNAFIKLVNTPVNKASLKAYIICSSRILNAVVFFSLSTITYAHLDGLGMVSVMMACLLFQCCTPSYWNMNDALIDSIRWLLADRVYYMSA